MPIEKPLLLQPVTGDTTIQYSARELRSGLLGALYSREGVWDLRGGHLKVTQRGQGANMTVDVAPGRAAVFGDDASDQGAYSVNSTTTLNLSIPAPSSSSSRTHRIILRVRDRSENGSWAANTYDAVLQVQADTSAATALPPTAIALATVTTPANASSVTTAMIGDLRDRSSVGTAAVDGSMGAFYSGFAANDATRPCRWSVNPDGWVQLSGFLRWVDPDSTYGAWVQQTMGGTPLNDPAIRPPGIRDFCAATSWGPTHLAVYPNGAMFFRYPNAVTLRQNQSWFSFDGCFYRI